MMRRPAALLALLLAGAPGSAAFAQQPAFTKPTPFIGPEQPTIGKDLKLHASDLLDLNLTVEDKGASITYAPLLYGLRDYHPLWSELRFKVTQANGRLSVGTGFVLNPLSPRGSRGVAAWTKTMGASSESRIQVLEQQQDDLATALDRLRADLAAATELSRQVTLLREVDATITRRDAIRQEIVALTKAEDAAVQARMVRFYEEIQKIHRPVVSVFYSAQLFESLGGTTIDVDGDGLRDNDRQLRAHRLSLAADLKISARLSVSGLASWNSEFVSAEEASVRTAVWVGGWTVGGLAKVLNPDYQKTDDYKKTLFIPAAVWGFAHEFSICSEDRQCPDGLTRRHVFTPFLDVKLKPAAQFRIGFPFSRNTVQAVSDGKTSLAAIAAFTIQVGAPK